MKNSIELYKAIGEADDAMVKDALEGGTAKEQSRRLHGILEAAACVAAVCGFIAASFFLQRISRQGASFGDDSTPDMTTAESTVTDVPDDGIDHSFDWQYEYDLEYENISIAGDYLFNDANASGRSLILKRNVHTGECTAVCTDPFCEHNSPSCPFYNTMFVVGIGNTMYGVMLDENINKTVLYSYDVETEKKENVYETTDSISELYQYKYFLYFRSSGKGVQRLDTRTGVIEKVKSQPGIISWINCGLIVWSQFRQNGEAMLTATDLLGNDPRPYNSLIYNGKLHGVIFDENYKSSYVQLDRSGSVEKVLIENSYFGFPVGNNFIYFGTDGGGSLHPNGENKANGDIYIAPLDTFESRLLCHVEEVKPYGFASSYLNALLSGDWIALNYQSKNPESENPESENRIGADADMLLVNMVTGEYHISRYME